MSHAKQLHNRRYLNDYLEIINREGLLCGRCCQALLPIFFSPVFSGYCLTSCRATLRLPLARSSPLTHAFIPIRIQKQINTG